MKKRLLVGRSGATRDDRNSTRERWRAVLSLFLTVLLVTQTIPCSAVAEAMAEDATPEDAAQVADATDDQTAGTSDGEAAEPAEQPAESEPEPMPQDEPPTDEGEPSEQAPDESNQEGSDTDDSQSTEAGKTTDQSQDESSTGGAVAANEDKKDNADQDSSQAKDEEKKETDLLMPAIDVLTSTSNGVVVEIHAPEGAFPEGTSTRVKPANLDTFKEAAEDVANGEIADVRAVDISFIKDGQELEPADGIEVSVSLRPLFGIKGEGHKVVHLRDDGKAEVVEDATATANRADFKATDFSVYGIIGDGITYDRIRLTFEDELGTVRGTVIVHEGDSFTLPDSPASTKEGEAFDAWRVGEVDISTYANHALTSVDIAAFVNMGTEDADDYRLYDVIAKATYFESSVRVNLYQWEHGTANNPIADTMYADRDGNVDLSKSTYTCLREGWGLNTWDQYSADGTSLVASYDPYSRNNKVINITEDTDLYPNLVPGYWVTFDTGDAPEVDSIFARQNSTEGKAILRHDLLKTQADLGAYFYPGYTLEGWYTDKELTNKVTTDIEVDATTHRVLYAKWTPVNAEYTVIYMVEGPEGKPGEGSYSAYTAQVKTGLTGTIISNEANQYLGSGAKRILDSRYYYNKDLTVQKNAEVRIKGDGTTIKYVYYNRNYWYLTGKRVTTSQYVKWGEPASVWDPDGSIRWGPYDSGWERYPLRGYYGSNLMWELYTEGGHPNGVLNTGLTFSPRVEGYNNPFQTIWVQYDHWRATHWVSFIQYWELCDWMTVQPGYEVRTVKGIKFQGPSSINRCWLNGYSGPWITRDPSTKTAAAYCFAYVNGRSRNSLVYPARTAARQEGNVYGYAVSYAGKTVYVSDIYYLYNSFTLSFQNITGVDKVAVNPSLVYNRTVKYTQPLAEFDPKFEDAIRDIGGKQYSFAGWFTNAAAAQNPHEESSQAAKFDFQNTTMPAGTLIAYAAWDVLHYDVTFESNGGTRVPAQENIESGERVSEPDPPTNGNLTFAGWFTDEGLTKAWSFSENTVRSDMTLYAKWIDESSYEVTYYDDDGTTINSLNDGTRYSAGTVVYVPAPPAARKNDKPFLGWQMLLDKEYEGDPDQWVLVGDSFAITKDTDLHAVYGENMLDPEAPVVTFVSNYPERYVEKEVEPGEVRAPAVNGAVRLPEELSTFKAPGYKIVGWNTAEDGSGDLCQVNHVIGVTEDVELYAIWEPEDDKITYDANLTSGVSGVTAPTEGKTFDEVQVSACGYAATGKYFREWNTVKEPTESNPGTVYVPGMRFELTTGEDKLYAQWDDVPPTVTCKVTYNANGGDGTMADTEGPKNYTVAVAACGFTREGYSFAGWNTEANGSGVSKAPTDGIKLTGDVTLYAQWKGDANSLTYNANGGAGSMFATPGITGQSVKVAPNGFTCAGHVFKGWYTNPFGTDGTPYAAGDDYVLAGTGNVLYAQWEAITDIANYDTLSYNRNPESAADVMVSTFGAKNGTVTVANNTFKREGYTFVGWNTAPDGSGTSYAPGRSYTLTDGNDVLYAQWSPIADALSYDGNGATSGSVPATTGFTGTKVLVAANVRSTTDGEQVLFERQGYIFTGWNTSADGDGTSYAVASEYTLTSGNDVLYAQWRADKGRTHDWLRYDKNAAAATGEMEDTEWVGSTSSTEGLDAGTVTVAACGFALPGHVFKGWNTQSDGSGKTYQPGDTYKWLYQEVDDVLYAQWNAVNEETHKKLVLEANVPDSERYSGTTPDVWGNAGSSVPVPACGYARPGYVFVGWNSAADGSGTWYAREGRFTLGDEAANNKLYAQWTRDTFSLSYSGNAADVVGTMASTTGLVGGDVMVAACTLIRAGYEFLRWNTAADETGETITPGTILKLLKNTVLYAVWTTASDTLTYNANGGTGTTSPTSGRTFDTVVVANNAFTAPVNKAFRNWNTAEDGSGIAYEPGDVYTLTADVDTLYAQWANLATLTLNPNGGAFMPGVTTTVQVATGLTATVPNSVPSRDSWTFAGWATAPGGSEELYWAGASVAMPGDRTLYAQWIPSSDAAGFVNPNGGTGVAYRMSVDGLPQTPTATVGQTVTLPTLVQSGFEPPADMVFDSWNTAANGSGQKLNPGDTIQLESQMNFYAIWVDASTLTFDANEGTGTVPDPISVLTGSTVEIPAAELQSTEEGYVFDSWNTRADGRGGRYAPGAKPTLNDDTTLYAHYAPNSETAKLYANNGDDPEPFRYLQNASGKNAQPDENVTFPTAADVRFYNDDKVFVGWDTSRNGEGSVKPGNVLAVEPGVAYYAIWADKEPDSGDPNVKIVTITYDPGDGAGTMTPHTYVLAKQETQQVDNEGNPIQGANPIITYTATATAPSCTFTAPKDHAFDYWEVQFPKEDSEEGGEQGSGEQSGTPQSGGSSSSSSSDELVPVQEGDTYAAGASILLTQDIILVAKYKNIYTGMLDPNGGSGTACYINVVEGEDEEQVVRAAASDELVKLPTPEEVGFGAPEGYVFKEWNTKPNGDGSAYAPAEEVAYPYAPVVLEEGETAGKGTYTVATAQRLYAIWTPDMTTTGILYENAAAAPVGEKTVYMSVNDDHYTTSTDDRAQVGDEVTLPDQPTGFANGDKIFAGWNTKRDGSGTAFSKDASYTVQAGQSLYAMWNEPPVVEELTLTFNRGKGKGTMAPMTSTGPTTLTLSPYSFVPPTGYVFTGWNTQADGKGESYADGAEYELTADATLYAQYTPNSSTGWLVQNHGTDPEKEVHITTYAGSGDYTTNTTTATVGDRVTLPDPSLAGVDFTAPSGKTFSGWSNVKSATSGVFQPGSKYTVRAGEKLYAIWVDKVTLTYDNNVAAGDANPATGSIPAQTVGKGTTVTVSDGTGLTRAGYTLTGWDTAATHSESSTAYALGAKLELDANTTLFAQWVANGDAGKVLPGYGREGNPAHHWITSAIDDSGKNTTIVDGGTLENDVTLVVPGTKVNLPAKPAEWDYADHVFVGWDITGDDTADAQPGDAYTIQVSTPIKAVWAATKQLTFNKNGADGEQSMTPVMVAVGTKATVSANTYTYTDHTFTSWNTMADGTGASYAAGATIVLNSDVELYAQWQTNNITLTYDAHGGTNAPATDSKPRADGGVVFTVDNGEPTRAGYTFLGWNTRQNGRGTAYAAGDTLTLTNNATLYAQWQAQVAAQYVLNFDANGGTGSMYGVSDEPGATVTLPECGFASPSNKKFVGWSASKDAQPTDTGLLKPGASFVLAQPTSTLYAIWAPVTAGTENQVTLSFDANGGVKPEGKLGAMTGTKSGDPATASFDIPTDVPMRVGYNFTGWNTKQNGTGDGHNASTGSNTVSIAISVDTTLYAQWTVDSNATNWTLSFDANEGSGTMADHTGTPGATTSLPKCGFTPKIEGGKTFKFAGWGATAETAADQALKPGATYTFTKEADTLYAIWTEVDANNANDVTLSFNANGGVKPEGKLGAMTGTKSGDPATASFTIPSDVPTREGYVFTGWSTTKNGSDLTRYGTASGQTGTIPIDADTTLYAQWETYKGYLYTLTFDANGGSGTMDNKTGNPGTTTSLPECGFTAPDASETGKVKKFAGWSRNPSPAAEATLLQPGATYTFTEETDTLYAIWTEVDTSDADQVTLSYNATGGDPTPASQPGTPTNPNTDYTFNVSTDVPTRAGYRFIGWNTKQDGTGDPVSASTDSSTVTITIKTDTTLYAQWEMDGVNTALLHANNDQNDPEITEPMRDGTELAQPGDIITLPDRPQNFIYGNKTFVGWSTKALAPNVTPGSDVTTYMVGDTYEVKAGEGLWAMWADKGAAGQTLATLTYNANGGKGTMDTLTAVATKNVKVADCAFTREGYEFAGWNLQRDGKGAGYGAGSTITLSANTTLYAQWKTNANTGLLIANNGTSESVKIQKAGATAPAGETVQLPSVTDDYVSFLYDGHEFVGWDRSADGYGTLKPGDSYTVVAGEALYAIWTSTAVNERNITLSYDANGGTGAPADETKVKSGEMTAFDISTTTPTRAGFTFAGWSTKQDGTGTKYDASTPGTDDGNGGTTGGTTVQITIPADTTLWAQWVRNNDDSTTYTLTFDRNATDATGTMADATGAPESDVSLPECGFAYTGHKFVGWSANKDATASSTSLLQPGATYTLTKVTATLYAIWATTDNNLILSYNANGGSDAPSAQTATLDSSETSKTFDISTTTPTRAGFTFAGWNTKQDGTGDPVSASTASSTVTITIKTDTTLYAQWEHDDSAAKYTLTFDKNATNATGTMADATGAPESDVSLPECGFAYAGHKFVGWSRVQSPDAGATLLQPGATYTLTKDIDTLYAIWTEVAPESEAKVTLTYYRNHNETDAELKAYSYKNGATVNLANNMYAVPQNYAFAGWDTQRDGNGKRYEAGHPLPLTVDTVLYAQWEPNEYTGLLIANNGTNPEQTAPMKTALGQITKVGDTAKLPGRGSFIAPTGKIFTGWNTKRDGYGTPYAQGAEFPVTAGACLYAQWADAVTLWFDANKGEGTMVSVKVTANTKIDPIPANEFTRANHEFTHWDTKRDDTGSDVANKASVQMGSSDITLYAQWKAENATGTAYSNDVKLPDDAAKERTELLGKKGQAISAPANPFGEREGYVFLGWSTARDPKDGTWYNVGDPYTIREGEGIYAQWADARLLDFDPVADDATGTMSPVKAQTGSDVDVPGSGFARKGYTFRTWNTAEDGSGATYDPESSVITLNANRTLYAMWDLDPDTGLIFSNQPEGDLNPPIFVNGTTEGPCKPGEKYTLMPNPFDTPKDHEFTGYNTERDGSGTWYQPGQPYTVKAGEKLYAQWRWIPMIVVWFDKNADDATGEQIPNPMKDVNSGSLEVPECMYTRAGWEFVTWNTKPDGSGQDYPPHSTYARSVTRELLQNEDIYQVMAEAATMTLDELRSTHTLYAQWRRPSVDGSGWLMPNGGVGEPTPIGKRIGDVVRLPGSIFLPPAGRVFVGWNTRPDGSGKWWWPGSEYTIKDGEKLYAIWGYPGIPDYTGWLIPNGGGGDPVRLPGDIGDKVRLPECTFLPPEGKRFVGWNTKPDGTGTWYQPGDEYVIKDGESLYAIWGDGENTMVEARLLKPLAKTADPTLPATLVAGAGALTALAGAVRRRRRTR